ncbi:universal stress protein [Chitinophaga defluvii]|uniref:Universal stress protein n=1 Tax=Chitinophaga defluvii TaxID=3163343 RepID=A0ABV2T3R8_9BACT
MEKIILVILGAAPAPNALNFACYLSDLTRSRLTGLFFQKDLYTEQPALKQLYGMTYVESIVSGDLPEHNVKKRQIEEHMRNFKENCEEKGIQASTRYIQEPILEEIISESRFSDLIIVDAAVSYTTEAKDIPATLLKEILSSAQCPVIIAPVIQEPIEEIVFCYDGSPSSIFAMKQLTYLLPELTESRGTVLQIQKEGEVAPSEKKMITTWLSKHFTYSDFTVLKGNTEDELFTYLLKKKHALIVMGAYGRGIVSRFFKHSHADLLIKTLAYPVFITHY